MKELTALILCLLSVGALSDKQPCICVPYYYCDYNDQVVLPISAPLDLSIDPANPYPTCTKGVEICCGLPDQTEDSTGKPKSSAKTKKPPVKRSLDRNSILVPKTPSGVNGCGLKRLKHSTVDSSPGNNISDKPESTFFGEFPWMIALFTEGNNNKHLVCGGSLIAPAVVLTGATCVVHYDVKQLVVRAGDWDLGTTKEPLAHQNRRAVKVSVHKDYESSDIKNDIALIWVDRPFELGPSVDTICLSKQQFKPVNCLATGWGGNSFNNKMLPQQVMKKVHQPLVDRDTCQAKLRLTDLGPDFNLHKSFICAGGVIDEDTCAGDGGGPLVCSGFDGPNKFTQVGIVSWGVGCAGSSPAVYTSVEHFYYWIAEQLKW